MIELLNTTIKYCQQIAKEKGLGAIPYPAISKCWRVTSAASLTAMFAAAGGALAAVPNPLGVGKRVPASHLSSR
jgi:hypothetical protein